jgi:AraC family transcriptional regulator
MSSVFAVHLTPATPNHSSHDISNIPSSLYFENNNLKATLLKLQSILDGSSINDHAYAETLGLLLLWELEHVAYRQHSQLNPVRGGLTALQLRRIKEFVDAHISKQIGISELANLVGLSRFYFIRAFKQSVGLSPYQYVLSERISVAKDLLLKRDLSIGAVALLVGFSDASQLNRTFLKLTGIPSRTSFARQAKTFTTESEAKQFAKAKLAEGMKVTAGTLVPQSTSATHHCGIRNQTMDR